MGPMDATLVASKSITLFVGWVFAPAMMLGSVALSRITAERLLSREDRIAARAGWWAGVLLFVLYFLYQFPGFEVPQLFVSPRLELNLIGATSGLLAGFLILRSLNVLMETKVYPFLLLLLSFGGAAAWYHYVFVGTYNALLLSVCLGIALGLLLHVALFPHSRRTLLLT